MDRQQRRRFQAIRQSQLRLRLIVSGSIIALLGIAAAGYAPAPLPVRRLAPGVYAVLGDTGRGSEGRANAGFVVTEAGVVVIDALGSPAQAHQLVQSIRSITSKPIKWLILTHHHPDHHFGAVVFRRLGARIIAHPDRRVLASEAGEDALVADWIKVVGLDAMRGFEFADIPDDSVTDIATVAPGGQRLIMSHPGAAHSGGDLMVWLPRHRILFAGDLLVEDGVTMVVDGNSKILQQALSDIERLQPWVIVPGHGAIPADGMELVSRTRSYITALRAEMKSAVERSVPMTRAMKSLPPADPERPVSLNSRRRRNAVRVYLEEERVYMGLDSLP